jgi:large repetitive protein
VITGVSSNNPEFVATNYCGNPVAPFTSCSISVAFTPKMIGLTTGTLTITSNAGTRTVSLSGSGQIAELGAA